MIFTQRVIHNVLDISVQMNDFNSGTHLFPYATGEYLYVGSEVPFNNLWFDVSNVNAATGSVSADIWFGNSWVAAVDIIDETAVSGVPLAQDGRITFSTDRLKGWDIEQTTEDVTGLTTFEIYNMYWMRFKWSQNLTGTTTLAWMGQKFSTDNDLYDFYPDLNNADLKLLLLVKPIGMIKAI